MRNFCRTTGGMFWLLFISSMHNTNICVPFITFTHLLFSKSFSIQQCDYCGESKQSHQKAVFGH